MATLTKAAQKKAAKKPYKGKYPGPDKYKGKPPPKKVTPVKKPVVKKPATPAATRATVPVANNNGSLVSPATWEQDQARLTAAREDQAELLDLNDQEAEANLEYNTDFAEQEKQKNLRSEDIARQRLEFSRQKEQDRANLNSNLSYRGVGSRGSAASRGWGDLLTEQQTTENNLNAQQTANDVTDWGNTVAGLSNVKNSRLTRIAGRRQAISGRASAGGVYTTGAGTAATGVTAPKPVSLKPPASPYNKTLAPKKPTKKVVKAAQRKVSKKKKK